MLTVVSTPFFERKELCTYKTFARYLIGGRGFSTPSKPASVEFGLVGQKIPELEEELRLYGIDVAGLSEKQDLLFRH